MLKSFRISILALWFLIATVPTFGADTLSVTILHTNDTHGRLLPFSYPHIAPPGSETAALSQRRDIGGIARRATLVKRIRAELAGRAAAVWLVDAGDFSDGTAFSIEYRGEADVAAMNAVGYDFATLGNHEFNYPLGQTQKLISLATYPILSANTTRKADGKPLARPHTIQTVGTLKVAIFGLTTHEAAAYPAAREELIVADEIDTARRMADLLDTQADLLIALSHCGEDVDERIAAAVPRIDVIVGGHSHSRLPSGKFVWHSETLEAGDINGTIIVQNHQWGGELGRLDLLLLRDATGRWRVTRYRARLLPVTAAIPEDAAVAAVVDKFWQPLAARYGERIGEAADDFVTIGDDLAEYNLMADAIRATFKTDFVVENIGGVRAPLVKGPITRGDLALMDPFDNTIVTFAMSGQDLRKLLKKEAPAVSGLRYHIEGKKVTKATCNGKKLEDKHMYTGAANSFFARKWLKDVTVKDSGRKRLDVLVDYVRRQGTVMPAYDGRRIYK
jgi:5'-nucleotidase